MNSLQGPRARSLPTDKHYSCSVPVAERSTHSGGRKHLSSAGEGFDGSNTSESHACPTRRIGQRKCAITRQDHDRIGKLFFSEVLLQVPQINCVVMRIVWRVSGTKSREKTGHGRGSTPTSAIRIGVMLRSTFLVPSHNPKFTFYLAKVQCGESCILPVSVRARVNR